MGEYIDRERGKEEKIKGKGGGRGSSEKIGQ